MTFRTEIERPAATAPIPRGERIVMLGSCFTDNVGALLARDGFDVTHNPMGPLYNPASLRMVVCRALEGRLFTQADLLPDAEGRLHCLWFASRYQGDDPEALLYRINTDFAALSDALLQSGTVILTLGTAYAFSLAGTGMVVGNCHKFPASAFTRSRLSVEQVTECLLAIKKALGPRRLILTVSPVRHTADTLHGNQISKATLLLAVERAATEYFPAYEIMNDDLRDYRFYASDMKHPSETAVEYIYRYFCDTYFTPATMLEARESRKKSLQEAHRKIFME